MLVSECCGAYAISDTDLCSECLEHTEFTEEEREDDG